MKFSDKLQTLRRQAALTQDDFAAQIGVSRQTVSKWESDTAYPDLKNLGALCSFFSVSANTLLNPKIEDLTPAANPSELDISSFSENLRRLRTSRGIAQETFAELMNVSRQSVSKWENGSAFPKIEVLITMLEVLDADLDQLLPPLPVPPQASEETDDAQSPQKKRKSKKGLFILIPVAVLLLALLTVTAILIVPFLGEDPLTKTAKTVFFDPTPLLSTTKHWAKKGFEVTLGTGEDALTLGVTANDEQIAMQGLSVKDDSIILLPRKDTQEAIESSPLAPNNKTALSLSNEDYTVLQNLLRLLETDGGDVRLEQNVNTIKEDIESRLETIVTPTQSYSLANGKFALNKTVTYTLDKKQLLALIDAIEKVVKSDAAKEIGKSLPNEEYENYYVYCTKYLTEIEGEIKKLKAADCTLSYSVTAGKLDYIEFELTLTDKDNIVTKTSFTLNCAFYGNELGFDASLLTSVKEKNTSYSQRTSYVYRKIDVENVLYLSFTSKNETILGESTGSQSFATEGTQTLYYYRDTGKFSYAQKIPELDSNLKIEGSWQLDPKAKTLHGSLDLVKVDGKTKIETDKLVLSVRSLGGKALSGDEKDLFSMSEQELRIFYRNLPAKKLDTLYKELTGKDYGFLYSREGLFVPSSIEERADRYREIFLKYLKSEPITTRVDRVYIYDKKLDVYILLYGSEILVREAGYAYELDDFIKEHYREAKISGNKIIVSKK